MLPQVALASAMIILTAGIQTLFTVGGVRMLRRHAIKERAAHLWRATLVVGLFVLWLFLATVFQVAAWALLYVGLDAFFTLIKFGWRFEFDLFRMTGGIIFAIGISMIALAALVWLPRWAIALGVSISSGSWCSSCFIQFVVGLLS